jgi:hypothetical protein
MVRVSVEWEICESGPAGADRTVLLLPGGLNTARSYAELMAQPSLAGVRLVAVTLPGHGGTPPPGDFSIENYARLAAELAADLGCDVVVGFSIGASVALEMAASGAFPGPVVLLRGSAKSWPGRAEGRCRRHADMSGKWYGHGPGVDHGGSYTVPISFEGPCPLRHHRRLTPGSATFSPLWRA